MDEKIKAFKDKIDATDALIASCKAQIEQLKVSFQNIKDERKQLDIDLKEQSVLIDKANKEKEASIVADRIKQLLEFTVPSESDTKRENLDKINALKELISKYRGISRLEYHARLNQLLKNRK
jgi:multidrug resistance efflux pump